MHNVKADNYTLRPLSTRVSYATGDSGQSSSKTADLGPSLVFYTRPIGAQCFSMSHEEIAQSQPLFSRYRNQGVEYETWAGIWPFYHFWGILLYLNGIAFASRNLHIEQKTFIRRTVIKYSRTPLTGVDGTINIPLLSPVIYQTLFNGIGFIDPDKNTITKRSLRANMYQIISLC